MKEPTDSDVFDLQAFLPYLLASSAEEASLGFQRVYKSRYGMLRTEWRVLFHLGNYGSMTATEIGTRAKIHKTKISRAVAALEKRRFLKRQRSDADRRSETLALTPAGLSAYRDLRQTAFAYDSALTSDLTAGEVAQLRSLLSRLTPPN